MYNIALLTHGYHQKDRKLTRTSVHITHPVYENSPGPAFTLHTLYMKTHQDQRSHYTPCIWKLTRTSVHITYPVYENSPGPAFTLHTLYMKTHQDQRSHYTPCIWKLTRTSVHITYPVYDVGSSHYIPCIWCWEFTLHTLYMMLGGGNVLTKMDPCFHGIVCHGNVCVWERLVFAQYHLMGIWAKSTRAQIWLFSYYFFCS